MKSWLFVPGDSERKLAKSLGAGADVLVIDLEDSVAGVRKEIAREMTAEFVQAENGTEQTIYVRVNAWDTGLTPGDLAVVVAARPDGLLIPKASREGWDDLHLALTAAEEEAGIEKGVTAIATVVSETAAALIGLADPPRSLRLSAMMWGAEDLSADIGATAKRDEQGNYLPVFVHARVQCLLAARALGVLPVDTVYPDFRDDQGFARETREGKAMGYGAKAAIHPVQVPIINEVYAVSDQEVAWAKAVVAAFAAEPEAGVLSMNGEMIDRPHLRLAERILASG